MKPPFPVSSHAAFVVLAICFWSDLFLVKSRAGEETVMQAAVVVRAGEAANTPQTGVRLLEDALAPSRVTLLTARCDQLVVAVSKTTLQNPNAALSILHAALSRGTAVKDKRDAKDGVVATLPCSCARRIFLASVAATPKRASDLFDLATLLYPDCTPEFADALRAYGTENSAAVNFETPVGVDSGGFGVGFGPGFPGAPGFSGSAPSGATALPPGPLTIVVNG